MSVDLTTQYLGLTLKNPLVASACPLTGDLEMLRQLDAFGAAAAVLPSLFEEQIEHEENETYRIHADSAESLSYFPELAEYDVNPRGYVRLIEEAKKVTSIPIIASLNGTEDDCWLDYARQIEEAGADALELNIYFVPTDLATHSSDVERRYIDLVAEVRQSSTIPLAVKIGPYISSLPHFAWRLVEAGADGLVLFNRFLEPDIDLESMTIEPDLVLSNRHELRLPLRWIAILRDQISASLAASSGIHFADDIIKVLLAGADVATMATVLMRYGPSCLDKLLAELEHWLSEHGYDSVDEIRGSMSYRNCPEPGALERAYYMKALVSFTSQNELHRAMHREQS